jgi:hypothetical protein
VFYTRTREESTRLSPKKSRGCLHAVMKAYPRRTMTTTTHSRPGSRLLDSGATLALGRDVLLLASLLAFGVIGWEHAFHSLVLGVAEDHSAADHLVHTVRDAVLAFPIAVVAVVAGRQ